MFDLEQELSDRFGSLPAEVENLIELSALKTQLRQLIVVKLECRAGQLSFAFDMNPKSQQHRPQPSSLVQIVKDYQGRANLSPKGILSISLEPYERKDPLPLARSVSARLIALNQTNRS